MWLGRFEAPLPLRCRGRFHLYAATEAGRSVLVVIAAENVTAARAEACLARLFEAHKALDGTPGIARALHHGSAQGRPFVTFDHAVLADGETLVARLGELRLRVAHDEALTIGERLTGALAAAHRARPPLPLGPLGWCNVLVDERGELWWLGFGHNVCTLDETGALVGAPAVFVAPEAAAGAAPAPASDVHALYQLQQALLPFVALPATVQEVFAGHATGEVGRALATIVEFLALRVLAAPPGLRATLDETRQRAAEERALLGLALCPEHAAATLLGALQSPDATTVAAAATGTESDEWTFAVDGAWYRLPSGETYAINRRPARQLLAALVAQRDRQPGARLDVEALLTAGWPGERPLFEAGRNRVYVALSTLRSLGLRDLIERDEAGYRLAPTVRLVIAPSTEPGAPDPS